MIKEIARFAGGMPVTRKIGYLVLGFNQFVWEHLPDSILRWNIFQSFGHLVHTVVKIRDSRTQNPWTFFLRNRPEMDLVHEIVSSRPDDSKVNLLVLACSVGMEVYSIQWKLNDLKSRFNIQLSGLELSEESLERAKKGEYPLDEYEEHMERLSDRERDEFFSIRNNVAAVHPWLKENIKWYGGNACDPDLVDLFGEQDIVLANRFLCHMSPEVAGKCLDNITKLIKPGGYLFVSGVDLDVRKKVMEQSGFEPVNNLLEEIHNGDHTLLRGWPWNYWGLEPFSDKEDNYISRYAMVYKRVQGAA